MVHKAVILVLISLVFGNYACAQNSLDPSNSQKSPSNNGYIDELLQTIIERTKGPPIANLRVAERSNFSRDRKLVELISGEKLKFDAVGTKPSWEENLITIRIPLRKGLQGYRLFFINKQDQSAFENTNTFEDFQIFPTGSGAQWSTTPLLEASGFNVVKGGSKSELMKMLSARRFVTFGRGIDEIYFEYDKNTKSYPNLAIEQNIAVFIPHPTYIFVSPKHPDLAKRFETGLRDMIADGSFDRLFLKYFKDDIERANLDQRRVFTIANSNLSKDTPLDDEALWYTPKSNSNKQTN